MNNQYILYAHDYTSRQTLDNVVVQMSDYEKKQYTIEGSPGELKRLSLSPKRRVYGIPVVENTD